MQQVSSQIYITIILVAALASTISEAKNKDPQIRTRGCSLYGHSCFGGHGKRSEYPASDGLSLEVPIGVGLESNRDNPDMPPMNMNMGFNNENTLGSENTRPEKDIRFAAYALLKQWMNDYRRVHSASPQNADSVDTYKNNNV